MSHDPNLPGPEPERSYFADAEAQDKILGERLAEIRDAQERGEISTREAADRRIAAMEDHLAVTRALRLEYFGS